MTVGLIDRFMSDVSWLSNQNPDGAVYHAKVVKYTGVSSQNAAKWLNNRGWRPVNKGSAKKVFIEKWLPPHPMIKRELDDKPYSKR